MKKILLLIDNLGSGGAQNQISLLAKGLAEKGYTVLLCYYYPQDFFKQGLEDTAVELRYIPKKNRLGLEVIWQLARIIKTEKISTVISFLDTPNFYAVAANLLTVGRAKVAISYRTKTNFKRLSLARKCLYQFNNFFANHLVFNSFHEKEAWQAYSPSVKAKSSLIYNAVAPTRFRYQPRLKRQHKLLCVGSLVPAKNGRCIIDALQLLQQRGLYIHFTWVGKKISTQPIPREYAEEMESRIAAYGLEKYWTFAPPTHQIATYYYQNDALVLASTTEGLPNVACEALSCGLPLILSDGLDHPRLVDEGKNGRLFDPQKAHTLADAIEAFYKLPESEYTAMSANAASYAADSFSIEKFITSFTRLVEK